MITIAEIELEHGVKAKKWAGRCYEMACSAARVLQAKGHKSAVAVYGHYQGFIHEKSMFANRPIVQHGWVELSTGRVVDPTRWEFEQKDPYIYVGPGMEYDEGGNDSRMDRLGPPPEFNPHDNTFDIKPHLSPAAFEFIAGLLELDSVAETRPSAWERMEGGGTVSVKQLFWLGNYDPRRLRGHATEVLNMLKHHNLQAFVPLDNQLMVEQGRL